MNIQNKEQSELEELVYYGLVWREGQPADAEEVQGLKETAQALITAHTNKARISEIKLMKSVRYNGSYETFAKGADLRTEKIQDQSNYAAAGRKGLNNLIGSYEDKLAKDS